MARKPNSSDFSIDVDGIGRFIFARRTMRDTYRIRGDYGELTNGNYDEDGAMVDISALGYATIKTLMVSGPEGWSLDEMDPLSDEDPEEQIMKVFTALREKELSFRRKSSSRVQAEREGPGGDVRDVLQEEVQPSAD